ncbi:MAG: hypothetical protein L0H59_04025, partial [Tomitella sp.]|nr:hypothetical protein [Tomitella sp.]
YSTYNWPAIIVFGIIGFALAGLTGWLKREGVGWPASWQRAFADLRLAPSSAAGTRARASRLMFAGPVSAQTMHGTLLEAIAPDPGPGRDPRVYLVESVQGQVTVAFGCIGRPPLWDAQARITAIGPQQSSAELTVGATTPAGPSPHRDGAIGGEVLDAMFSHVEVTVAQRQPMIAVNRGRPVAGAAG